MLNSLERIKKDIQLKLIAFTLTFLTFLFPGEVTYNDPPF